MGVKDLPMVAVTIMNEKTSVF